MKESQNDVWKYLGTGWPKLFVKRWLARFKKSGLAPVRKMGVTIQQHLENILTFCRHRITKGEAEGLVARSWPSNGRLAATGTGTISRPPSISLRRSGPLTGHFMTGSIHGKT